MGNYVIALIIICIIVFAVTAWLKKQNPVTKGETERCFTEDDRRVVLLIQELGDVISTVEKNLR